MTQPMTQIRSELGPPAAAVAILVALCLSGLLDVSRASDFKASANLFTDAGGLKVADWVRHNTSPTARSTSDLRARSRAIGPILLSFSGPADHS